jgi:hypothetical protein
LEIEDESRSHRRYWEGWRQNSHQLLEAIRKSGVKRYIAVGGAGSLEIAPGKLLKDSGNIPAEWLPAINEGAAFLKLLRADNQLDWTLIHKQRRRENGTDFAKRGFPSNSFSAYQTRSSRGGEIALNRSPQRDPRRLNDEVRRQRDRIRPCGDTSAQVKYE